MFEGLHSQKYNSLSEIYSAAKKVTFIDNHMQQKFNMKKHEFELLVESTVNKVTYISHNNNQIAFPKSTIHKHAKMLTNLFISHKLTFISNNNVPFSSHLQKMLGTGNPLPEKGYSPMQTDLVSLYFMSSILSRHLSTLNVLIQSRTSLHS